MLTGGCRCGAVHYTLVVDEMPPVYACHCNACQRWTGSAFSEQSPVQLEALVVTGELATFDYETPSGASSRHFACAKCFARIYNVNSRLPGFAMLRAGTREDAPSLEPVVHLWTSRRQPWVRLPEGVAQFDENAPPEVFAKLLPRV